MCQQNDAPEQSELSDQELAELVMLYEATGHDTRELKRQQWTVTYYGMLLLAGIVGYVSLRTDLKGGFCQSLLAERHVVTALGWLIAAFGTWYLTKCQASIVDYRKRARRIRDRWSDIARQVLEEKKCHASPARDLELVLGLMVSLVAGASLVTWILCYSIGFVGLYAFYSLVFAYCVMAWRLGNE